MKSKNFFILAMVVLWFGLTIWSFFWWKPNPQDTNISQNVITWFTQELLNTENVVNSWALENSWTTQEPTQETKTDYTQINVMMPRYFYNQWFKKFAEDLYNNHKIYMNFVFIDDLNTYRDQLFNSDFSDADLFLFPYDRKEKIPTKTFTPQQSIEPYFDPLLSVITKDFPVKFLPFSADPMIMYVMSWYTDMNDFYSISELVLNWESTRPLSFPLFFGLDSEDFYDRWFVWEYQDIVWYALIHYFTTYNSSHDLQTRIDSNVLRKYTIQDLNTISNIISTPECKFFPALCFQIYNFVWVRFGFLSDTDVVNQYLKIKKSDFSSLQKLKVPFFQLESPIRIRWRWIRGSLEDTKIINAIYTLYIQYINKRDEYNLWNSTLPVFKANQWNWLMDNKYIWLRWYILQSGWDFISKQKWIDKFQNLIEYKITAKEYLK